MITKEIQPAITGGFIDEIQLRRILPLSRRTIFNLRQRKKLPFIRIGRRVLYDPETVRNAFLRQQQGAVD